MKKRYLSAALALAMVLTMAGCSGGGNSSTPAKSNPTTSTPAASGSQPSGEITAKSDTIKIGLVAPLSGNNATYGVKQENGYRLAMDEINANGGIYGAQLVL